MSSCAPNQFQEVSNLQDASAAFRELYCRTTNPARPYMLWVPEVREARRLFSAFRARMAGLVQEVRSLPSPGVNPQGSPCKMMWIATAPGTPFSLCRILKLCLWMCGQVKARGPPDAEDVSIAAHLLRLRDPATGQPLPNDLLAGEFGLFFSAGIESAGNAISWTL